MSDGSLSAADWARIMDDPEPLRTPAGELVPALPDDRCPRCGERCVHCATALPPTYDVIVRDDDLEHPLSVAAVALAQMEARPRRLTPTTAQRAARRPRVLRYPDPSNSGGRA